MESLSTIRIALSTQVNGLEIFQMERENKLGKNRMALLFIKALL